MKTPRIKKVYRSNQGFTLIETVVAILILSLAVGALLTLTANGIFSVRYARNQIVATNLAQEALEYIRNSRDNARQLSMSWDDWLKTLNVGTNGQYAAGVHGCFSPQGCIVDPYNTDASPIWEVTPNGQCPTPAAFACPNIWFQSGPNEAYYTYTSRTHPAFSGAQTKVLTSYQRIITAATVPSDPANQVTITATVTWKNGNTSKSFSQSILLTNWGQ